jgi:hypothetical protein
LNIQHAVSGEWKSGVHDDRYYPRMQQAAHALTRRAPGR